MHKMQFAARVAMRDEARRAAVSNMYLRSSWRRANPAYRRPNAMLFKGAEHSNVFAQLCGACGHIELYADMPRALINRPRALPLSPRSRGSAV